MGSTFEASGQPFHDLTDDIRERNRIAGSYQLKIPIERPLILPGELLAILSPVDPGRVLLDVMFSELLPGFEE